MARRAIVKGPATPSVYGGCLQRRVAGSTLLDMKQWFSFLVGGSCVYVLVAACSAASGPRRVGGASSSGAGGTLADARADGVGGSDSAVSADGALDAIADAVTDPVSDAAANPYQSGSRLKARVLVTADGARQFVGWRDTQLGLDCTFVTATDGKTRCLPQLGGIAVVYADSACSKPLVYAASNCHQASGIIAIPVTTGSGCTVQGEALQVGQPGRGHDCLRGSRRQLHSDSTLDPAGVHNHGGGAVKFVAATEQLE